MVGVGSVLMGVCWVPILDFCVFQSGVLAFDFAASASCFRATIDFFDTHPSFCACVLDPNFDGKSLESSSMSSCSFESSNPSRPKEAFDPTFSPISVSIVMIALVLETLLRLSSTG